MRNHSLIIALLALGACTPQSAVLSSGSYTAFIAEATSVSLAREEIDLDGYGDYHQVDCRIFEDEDEAAALRLSDREPVCGALDDGSEDVFSADTDGDGELDVLDIDDDGDGIIDSDDCDDLDPAVGADCELGEGDGLWPPYEQFWLATDGFHVVTEELDPWRGEAVVTNEGDLLVTFHHRLPGGADFWFQFAVDRFFQPTECVEDDNGDVVVAALDGDWLDEWSEDLEDIADLRDDEEAFAPYAHLDPYLDGGRLFYLNGNTVQYNPDGEDGGNDDDWFIPQQWAAGAAQAKFAEELMINMTPATADPALLNILSQGYYAYQIGGIEDFLYWCDMRRGEDPTENACMQALGGALEEHVDRAGAELDYVVAGSEDEPAEQYGQLAHLNDWRPTDGRAPGFDGWGEIHPSYVVFSEGSDLRIGGSAEGAFTLLLGSSESNTVVAMKGQFEIPKIKKDTWAPENVRETKRNEAQEASDEPILYCSKP